MLISEYKEFVYNLINPSILADRNTTLVYLSGKLANEATELFAQKDTAKPYIMDEAGDVCWYLINLFTFFNKKFTGELHTYGIYDQNTSMEYIVTSTGKLSGESLKKVYHGKNITDETLFAYLDACRDAFLNVLHEYGITLEEVMQNNYNKLSQRHGTSYNASFYKAEK